MLFYGFPKLSGCPVQGGVLLTVAQDIHAHVSGLAGSRCTALAAVSCSSRTVPFTGLSSRARVHLLQVYRILYRESEIHAYLERTMWVSTACPLLALFFASNREWPQSWLIALCLVPSPFYIVPCMLLLLLLLSRFNRVRLCVSP